MGQISQQLTVRLFGLTDRHGVLKAILHGRLGSLKPPVRSIKSIIRANFHQQKSRPEFEDGFYNICGNQLNQFNIYCIRTFLAHLYLERYFIILPGAVTCCYTDPSPEFSH